MATLERVRSADGTTIAFERMGRGPAMILVDGALGRGRPVMDVGLATLLAPHFTVYNYNRRGRGDSGDTAPYAVAREIEDIAALIDAAGGAACVYGISSGAILALDVANAFPARITMLALYEPPFIIDGSRAPIPSDYVAHLDALIVAGRRGEAVEYFLTAAMQLPTEYLAMMRQDPGWAGMEALAHTLAYDGRIVADTVAGKPLPRERWTAVTMPTLILDGEISEQFMHDGADALAALLPDAHRQTLPGQHHGVEPEALAPVLTAFFTA